MLDPLSMSIPLADERPPRPVYPQRKLLSPSLDHPDDYVLEFDYSAISNLMLCPRKSENYSVRSREASKDQSALTFGHLFHKLDEKRLLVGFTDKFDQYTAEKIASHFLEFPASPTDHRNQTMMQSVIAGYKKRYENDGYEKKILVHEGAAMVERPFKIPLMTIAVNAFVPYKAWLIVKWDGSWGEWKGRETDAGVYVRNLHILYTGRIDSMLTEADLYFVMDDKTSSRGGKEFEEAFRLSLQTRGYCWAAQKILGKPIAGLILNAVIVRAPTKTGKGTEYDRRTYFYSQDSLAEWEDDMKAHVETFVGYLVKGFFPQVALSFKSPCPSCDYHENCSLPREQRAADLASDLYRDVVWNPMYE